MALAAVEAGAAFLCPACGVPLTGQHALSPECAMHWWAREAIRHVRLARACDLDHAGKPCRVWHLGQALQARGYARELRRRNAP